jgi:hypothetical protein
MSRKEGVENGVADAAPVFCAVEKHAVVLGVSAPVFAAVRQYKGWAAGKKVERSEFEKSVKDFLNAPTGGC